MFYISLLIRCYLLARFATKVRSTDTLNLPQTSFPSAMKANLVQREPPCQQIRKTRTGKSYRENLIS
jgi:hypothetical protein